MHLYIDLCVLEYHGEKNKPDVEVEGYQGNMLQFNMINILISIQNIYRNSTN